MYAAYAIISFKDGTKQADVMSKCEIDAIRKRSKASGSGPWVTDYNEMAKKTVFRRASKWITLSPELADAFEKDDGAQFSAVVADDPISTKALFSKPNQPAAVEVQSEVRQDDSNPDLNPAPAPKPAKETPAQMAKRLATEASVPFDMFTAELNTRNIATDGVTSSWTGYDEVTPEVWEVLGSQNKTLAGILKKWGKK